MNVHSLMLSATAILFGAVALHQTTNNANQPAELYGQSAIGDVQALERAYEQWAAGYSRSGGNQRLDLPLGYSKALSADFTRAQGLASFDLVDGTVSIEVSGLADGQSFEVWLIDNRSGPGQSVRPQTGDDMRRLGALTVESGKATLKTALQADTFEGFEIDLVAVSKANGGPGDAGLLFGSPSLFQRLYHGDQHGSYAALVSDTSAPPGTGFAPLGFLVPRPAYAGSNKVKLAELVRRGERLFFEEEFDGNGRTCGTCHPATNNFTIDPEFIATLPDHEPLFVAEFNEDLATLERPRLMREFGLILENLDGFDDLANRFTMRGVPHTLALPTSLTPNDATAFPVQHTGWSSDGAPGSGSLRDFATGAVTQHFPRTLARQDGSDFRLPTEPELDALEAFQRSLGRQEDMDLTRLVFRDEDVDLGRRIFLNRLVNNNQDPVDPTIGIGQCLRCHANGGANVGGGTNNNFNTGVEQLPDQPARMTDIFFPCDGGFGREMVEGAAADAICSPTNKGAPAFGGGAFNTATVIEAADTGPFFHNNAVNTIEDAVAFYNTATFNDTDIGQAIGGIQITAEDVKDVAAFLRVINADENLRAAIASEKIALKARRRTRDDDDDDDDDDGDDDDDDGQGDARGSEFERALRVAIAENDDAIEVLEEKHLHADARIHLEKARELLNRAIEARNSGAKKRFIKRAIGHQKSARKLMVVKAKS